MRKGLLLLVILLFAGSASGASYIEFLGNGYFSGNVGIGVANPQAKLHVDGTVRADEFCIGDDCISSWTSGSGSSLRTDCASGEILKWDGSNWACGTDNSSGSGSSGDGVPIGTIAAFNLNSCPAGWSLADGSNGTPDLRGTFVRGLNGADNGRDVARALGSYQEDSFESHLHSYTSPVSAGQPNARGVGAGPPPGYASTAVWSIQNNAQTLPTGSSETRPKNVALLYCMKTSEGGSGSSSSLPSCSTNQIIKFDATGSGDWECVSETIADTSGKVTGLGSVSCSYHHESEEVNCVCLTSTGTASCSGNSPSCLSGNSLMSPPSSSDTRFTGYTFLCLSS